MSRSRAGWAFVLVLAFIGAAPMSAHRLDEYLQAARLDIDRNRVELLLDLTPGVAVAERVLSDIDANANRSISAGEAQDYVTRVLSAVALDVDGTPLRLVRLDSTCPSVDDILHGTGTLRIHAAASLPRLSDGLHQLRYRNANRPDIAVYLANALVPVSDRVVVTDQRRNQNQQELIVDYTIGAVPAPLAGRALLPALLVVALAFASWQCYRRVRVA